MVSFSIVSGKGGVGKSLVAYSLSYFFSKKRKVISLDADPLGSLRYYFNIYSFNKVIKTYSSEKAFVIRKSKDKSLINLCPFNAIYFDKEIKVNRLLCEGCHKCEYYSNVFKVKKVKNGEIRVKKLNKNLMYIGIYLYPGEHSSGKLVSEAITFARNIYYDCFIIDAPATIGCETIASLQESDFAILVLEPSLPSLYYAKRVKELIDKMNMKYFVVINKSTLNEKIKEKIKKEFKRKVIGEISYRKEIIDFVSKGEDVLKIGSLKEELKAVYERIQLGSP